MPPEAQRLHFVLSAPRSGSTWLATALNHHPEIYATEQRLFGRFYEVWPDPVGGASPRITLDAYAEGLARHFFLSPLGMTRRQFAEALQRAIHGAIHQLLRAQTGTRFVVDKVTPYLGTAEVVLEQIRRFFPEARLVLLVRDPRDVITSGTFDWLERERPASGSSASTPPPRYQLFVERREEIVVERFFDEEVLERWARYWREPLEAVSRCQGPEPLVVRYEEMLEDQAEVLRRLFHRFGVEDDPALARRAADASTFERMTGRPAGVARPLAKARRGVAGDWRRYFTRQDGLFVDRQIGDLLVQWGYERRRDWWLRLPENLSLRVETAD